jgi:nitrate/TMAO reductase-like tetraheme cytochrome c subunit
MGPVNSLGEVLVRYTLAFLTAVILVAASIAYADYRELFEKEFLSKPWGVEIEVTNACLQCHTSDAMSPDYQRIPQEWRMSWHYRNDVECQDCHGGDAEDATMAMSHQRKFVGKPSYKEVPQFCGKCHIGILKNYTESGHGKALRKSRKGPNCVTCHGSHNIQKVSIDIINSQRCSQCHSYERAKNIKQALFQTESMIEEIEKGLQRLRSVGVYPVKQQQRLFDTQAKFRTLFHTIDVDAIRNKNYIFVKRLEEIQKDVTALYKEISFRKKFATYLMLLFASLWVVVSIICRKKE